MSNTANKKQKIKEIFDNIREISVENTLNKDIVPIENLFLITQKARKKYKEAQAGGDELDYNNL